MFSSVPTLTLPLLLLSGATLLAQEPAIKTLPVSGDDLREVLGLGIQKTELDFGTPKFLIVRTEYHGHKNDLPINLPAAAKVTLLTYVQSKDGHLQYWLSTGGGDGMSAFVNFVLGEGDSTRSGLVNGVYTVRGAHSPEDADQHPAWKMEIVTSDSKPTSETASNSAR